MEKILTITEADIRPHETPTPETEYIKPRQATRVVIFDDEGRVALNTIDTAEGRVHYSMIGGGIDEGEAITDGLTREALEEAGCKIKNIKEIGIIHEYGVNAKQGKKSFQENFCYTAEVDGEKGESEYTEEDIFDGLKLVWLPVEVAIFNLKNQEDGFVTRKTLFLLEKAKKTREDIV